MTLFRHLTAIAAAALLALAPVRAPAATTILPPAETCFSATAGVSGMIGLLGAITGGSGYVNGTYGGVAFTGGSGSGATATIVVSGGAVTAVTILQPGIQYKAGDTISATAASIGGAGSGFSVPVSSTAINGSLASGTVSMFIPNTTTPKQTWQDSAQTILNSQPITLDANGCALIYGTGSYRQQLFDSLGNLVWDQVTTDTSANNNTFWAGLAGGTPNAITVTDVGFNGTDGSIIQFIPLSSNTGSTTINPSGFGAILIVKDTANGAVALSGGEIVAGSPSNVINVVYSASQANFHLLNLVNQAAPQTQQTLCGATGLKITNNVGTPNTQITLTADQVTAVNNSFQIASRTGVTYTINITLGTVTATANGMDGEAPGTSSWINIWAIDNGVSGAGLASVTATAPTMPSGYSYKCRLGAMRVDGASNLNKTMQLGARGQWVAAPAAIANGGNGGVLTATPVATVAPPTATQLHGSIIFNGAGTGTVLVAANNGTGGTIAQFGSTVADLNAIIFFSAVLESANIYYSSTAAGTSLTPSGWQDKVNAN